MAASRAARLVPRALGFRASHRGGEQLGRGVPRTGHQRLCGAVHSKPDSCQAPFIFSAGSPRRSHRNRSTHLRRTADGLDAIRSCRLCSAQRRPFVRVASRPHRAIPRRRARLFRRCGSAQRGSRMVRRLGRRPRRQGASSGTVGRPFVPLSTACGRLPRSAAVAGCSAELAAANRYRKPPALRCWGAGARNVGHAVGCGAAVGGSETQHGNDRPRHQPRGRARRLRVLRPPVTVDRRRRNGRDGRPSCPLTRDRGGTSAGWAVPCS